MSKSDIIMMRTFLKLTEQKRHVGNCPISAIYLKIGSAFKHSLSSSFKKPNTRSQHRQNLSTMFKINWINSCEQHTLVFIPLYFVFVIWVLPRKFAKNSSSIQQIFPHITIYTTSNNPGHLTKIFIQYTLVLTEQLGSMNERGLETKRLFSAFGRFL